MADFELDADSPYDLPSKELLQSRPEPLKYPQNHPKYRFYGNNIKTMIDVAKTWEDGEMKTALTFTIANHMKNCLLNWNKTPLMQLFLIIYMSLKELDLRAILRLADSSSL